MEKSAEDTGTRIEDKVVMKGARWSNQILLAKQVHTKPPYANLACAG